MNKTSTIWLPEQDQPDDITSQHTNKDGRNSMRSSPLMKRYRSSMAMEIERTIFSRDKIPPRSRPGQTQSELPQSLGAHTCIGPAVFIRPCFLSILHSSGSSNLSAGFSEPQGEGPDGDVHFRTENFKVSSSLHTAHLWLSLCLFPPTAGKNFSDNG